MKSDSVMYKPLTVLQSALRDLENQKLVLKKDIEERQLRLKAVLTQIDGTRKAALIIEEESNKI
jgi:hypothetical protein